jgi:ABC-type amino acid transport substrate-binding protein
MGKICWVACLGLALLAGPGAGQAAEEEDAVLVVGTKHAPPFSYQDEAGAWRGISIDLWEAAARELQLEYRYEEVELDELLSGLEAGYLDVSVAALTVTADREDRVDFAHPIHSSGLGIAVLRESSSPATMILQGLLSWTFLKAVGGIVLLLLAIGAAITLLERRRNREHFGGRPARGLGEGFWWAAVTMTTVGYGDRAPVTAAGRVLGIVWMFASILLISAFTATIASALTVERLGTAIQGPEDLPRVVVGTVPDSTSAAYLERRGITARSYRDLETAVGGLLAGECTAVVYDAPMLQHLASSTHAGQVAILPHRLGKQDYAFALREGTHQLRESLTRVLLRQQETPLWQETLSRYLGE